MNLLRALLRRATTDVTASRESLVPRSLDEALAAERDIWSADGQARIRTRLVAAAELEWATPALAAFDRDPHGFLRLHFEAVVEQSTTALDVWRAIETTCNRTGSADLDEALRKLGITEREWLVENGFPAVD